MTNRNKQQGFTLIELIVVIVILGILAVTAAPKFISFTSDAKQSAAEGVKGSMLGGMNMTFAKAIIEGKETTVDAGLVGGVDASYGYPTATAIGIVTAAGISVANEAVTSDFVSFITATTITLGASSGVTLSGTPVVADIQKTGMCYLVYTEASSAADADIATVALTCVP